MTESLLPTGSGEGFNLDVLPSFVLKNKGKNHLFQLRFALTVLNSSNKEAKVKLKEYTPELKIIYHIFIVLVEAAVQEPPVKHYD